MKNEKNIVKFTMSKVKIKPKQGQTGGRIDSACQT